MRGMTWIGVVSLFGLFAVGCPTTDSSTPVTATAVAESCTTGASKCVGTYGGEVAEGNNAPAGANVAVCKDGSWSETTCDASANEGCYSMEDPATGDMQARCVSAMSMGE